MAPYSTMAALMADYPESTIFRRFQRLRAKLNLFLQAELCSLEKELDNIVQEAMHPAQDSNAQTPPENLDFEWKTIRSSQTPLAQDHRKKMEEIQQKLAMYDDQLAKWCQVQQLGSATRTNLGRVQDWLLCHKPWNKADMEPWLGDDPTELLTLSPKLDGFDRWLGDIFIPIWHRMIGEKLRTRHRHCHQGQEQDPEAQATLSRYAPKELIVIGDVCTVLLTSAIFICSVLAVNFAKGPTLRLTLVSVMTIIFSSILMFVARCRRFEVFAGTAAFCAVLTVFFQEVFVCK